MTTQLRDLQTPCLLLDLDIMARNIARVQTAAQRLGVGLRPHVKTPKAIEIGKELGGGIGPITVSTLSEADVFASAGFNDILYATLLSASKVSRVEALLAGGCRLLSLVDSPVAVAQLAAARRGARPLPVLIEIDVDGHRAGVRLGDAFDALAALLIADSGFTLLGAMSYAGASYDIEPDARAVLAERHRRALVAAGQRIAALGGQPEILSFGSTPALMAAATLEGVTEVRGGIFVFQDLFQAGIGACTLDDIALSVLSTVVGHQPDSKRLWIDAGGMALSKDRSTAGRSFDARYGLVTAADGRRLPLWVADVHQELGLVESIDGTPIDFGSAPIGGQLRILPNHSDMTAAAYDRYHLLRGGQLVGTWARHNGW
ncbi:alanine racemase [Sandaracinobacteroides saxicola]|uniref:Alanine racemase n=1 Tax=Sandaracinobacteroides saxicola TaxID=2759707 RepID=A0A7G5IDX5_9SPHN|nr:alanine racemase [Sandaracinobacteroides saxicola]QMW21567.1 alanine racemase [Sandaracinobacteroides saxicola]